MSATFVRHLKDILERVLVSPGDSLFPERKWIETVFEQFLACFLKRIRCVWFSAQSRRPWYIIRRCRCCATWRNIEGRIWVTKGCLEILYMKISKFGTGKPDERTEIVLFKRALPWPPVMRLLANFGCNFINKSVYRLSTGSDCRRVYRALSRVRLLLIVIL